MVLKQIPANHNLSDSKTVETKEYPIIAVNDIVVFPKITTSVVFAKSESKLVIREALSRDRLVVILLKKQRTGLTSAKDLYSVGVLAKIIEFHKLSEKAIALIIEGQSRVVIERFTKFKPYLSAKIKEVPEIDKLTLQEEALMHNIDEGFKKCVASSMSIPMETLSIIFAKPLPSEKADLIAFSLGLKPVEKQKILETFDLKTRLEIIYNFVNRKLEILQVAKNIEEKTTQELNKAQREIILREQLKTIQKELGLGERADIRELKKKIKKANMTPQAKKIAEKELIRLLSIPSFSPEISYIRAYLDWLTSLPWDKKSKSELNIKQAQKILDEDHYGLKNVKERILEYIAVNKLSQKMRGPILCFVGPPGTGKTSVGRSIARALKRKFVRISLGGIKDEAEIRGHRRTYVGALPGRIIQGIKMAGTKNPVFMLDEIDKVGTDFRGDPSSALLEALDPEQNYNFSDHYIEVPFDLSDVMFITTANVLDTIPVALRDRMEVIRFPGYTQEEKFNIAKNFLIPKLMKSHGLEKFHIKITDEAIRNIIGGYTREAGVRNLEREIAKICRKLAKKIVEKQKKIKDFLVIDSKNLYRYLGPIKFHLVLGEEKNAIGVATGLAWTPVGGEIIFIEATKMSGKGKLLLTGHLGEVMKESAQAAFSYVRSHAQELGIKKDFYKKLDIHIHVPEGAVPKDGPSAGIAVVTALTSCLSSRPVKRDIAMTGEITLRGKVLEIGGLKEKVLAAHRSGLKKIVLPIDNKKDLEKISEKVKKDLKFICVKNINEALKVTLCPKKKNQN